VKAQTLAKQLSELRTKPNRPGAEDVEAMANRVVALDLMYHAARRDDPANTLHHRYTGLWNVLISF
jgi:hypothetical protein